MTTPDSLRYVEGELNYLVPMAERPRYFAYDAGPDAPTNMAHEAHRVRIRDMRPISGEVTEINERLDKEPALVNTDPYGEGWMIKIRVTDSAELDALLSSEDYAAQLG